MSDYKVESNGPHSISILIWEISQIEKWARKWFLLFSRFYDSAGGRLNKKDGLTR